MLNYDLCYKLYARDSPACRCGSSRETAFHYLFKCPLYNDIRAKLISDVSQHTACSIDILLHGDRTLSLEANRRVFDAVHNFICDTNRFI